MMKENDDKTSKFLKYWIENLNFDFERTLSLLLIQRLIDEIFS